MTLKTKKDSDTKNGYDASKAFEAIQEQLKTVIESHPVPLTTRYKTYYMEESTRLEYIRDYGKKFRNNRREFGRKRKVINQFFRENRGKLSTPNKGSLLKLDQLLS